mmetsp:Transcript_560/g.1115  ORF Transcript_560/g.1115 Transcript_560/m.1115 type:complete len:399 (-) Transcript_560:1069-2265(-)
MEPRVCSAVLSVESTSSDGIRFERQVTEGATKLSEEISSALGDKKSWRNLTYGPSGSNLDIGTDELEARSFAYDGTLYEQVSSNVSLTAENQSLSSFFKNMGADFRRVLRSADVTERRIMLQSFRESYVLHLLEERGHGTVLRALRSALEERKKWRSLSGAASSRETVKKILESKAFMHLGQSIEGYPIFWIKSALVPFRHMSNARDMLLAVASVCDLTFRSRPPHIESLVVVIDEKGKPPLNFNLRTEGLMIASLIRMFPGILHKLYIVGGGLSWKVSQRVHSKLLPRSLLNRYESVPEDERQEFFSRLVGDNYAIPAHLSAVGIPVDSDYCVAHIQEVIRMDQPILLAAPDVFGPIANPNPQQGETSAQVESESEHSDLENEISGRFDPRRGEFLQ